MNFLVFRNLSNDHAKLLVPNLNYSPCEVDNESLTKYTKKKKHFSLLLYNHKPANFTNLLKKQMNHQMTVEFLE